MRSMSAIGTKRTCLVALHMSAFGGKANTSKDMPRGRQISILGVNPTSLRHVAAILIADAGCGRRCAQVLKKHQER